MRVCVSSKVIVLLIGFCAAILIGAGSVKADFTFGTPTNLGSPINTSYDDQPVGITADGLSLYLASKRLGGQSQWVDIWVATRPTKDDPWGEPVNLGPPVNTERSEEETDISADGLTLYIRRAEGSELTPNGVPNWDIWVSTRATADDPWDTPVNLGPPVNTPVEDMDPSISADGLTMYFSSRRSGGLGGVDLWMTTRPTINDQWSEPVNLGSPVNGLYHDDCPEISPDDLILLFSSNRPGGFGGGSGDGDLWMSTRPTKNDPWSEPVNLGPEINSEYREQRVRFSGDGTLILFESSRPGGMGQKDIWQAPIIQIIDFNGDGIVDSVDLCIMIDHWGENYSLCDISPVPFGDGIVDVQDLIVLAEHMYGYFKPIAHWTLNEMEGNIAYDKVGKNDGLVYGGALWQPTGGKVGGALQFDGIDNYVNTPFILNPIEESFSVTAWIRGGVPGQVIISQADVEGQSAIESGSTWLGINQSDGRLMTGLMDIFFGPLESESVVADGQWHHVGLVYDLTTMKRHLYADGAQVAVDAGIVAGVQSTAGLYIGAGQILDVGTFFMGFIDDVRIYNQALGAKEIEILIQ